MTLMINENFGQILNPDQNTKQFYGVKGEKQRVILSHTPSTIGANEDLYVTIPNPGADCVIFPGSLKLLFQLELESSDPERGIVQNIGKSLIEDLKIEVGGKPVQKIEDADIWYLYKDLWLSKFERYHKRYLEGLCEDDSLNSLRVGAKGTDDVIGEDKAIAEVYKNTFAIPLGELFELIKDIPFYRTVFKCETTKFTIHFPPHYKIVKDNSGETANGEYKIKDIKLEFEILKNEQLATALVHKFQTHFPLPYEHVHRERIIPCNKSDSLWNWSFTTPYKSLKGIALIFVDPEKRKRYSMNNEMFYNPSIKSVKISVEGDPNQLFSDEMTGREMYKSALRFFGDEDSDVTEGEFLTTKFCLWIDFRSSHDHSLHGSGLGMSRVDSGISLQIKKEAKASGQLLCYAYTIADAQIIFENGLVKELEN